MTKHIISINSHNFYRYLIPSVFLKWGFFTFALIMDEIYNQSTPKNIFNSGFDPQYTVKFDKI